MLGAWRLVKDRCVGEYVKRKDEEIVTRCRYAVAHNELRGALVHGARREGVDRDVKVREALFLLDPVCPLADLLIVLNSMLKT